LAYIPISIVILLLSLLNRAKNQNHKKAGWRYALLVLPLLFIGITHKNIKAEYKKAYQVNTISPFGGWLLLNNVSTILPEIRNMDISKIKGARERELHQFLMNFPDSVYSVYNMIIADQMWNTGLPPKQYLFYQMQETKLQYVQVWTKLGVTFDSYAKQIIAAHPLKYLTHYVVHSFASIFTFYDIVEGNGTFQSDKTIENYYKISATTYENPPTIFKEMNQIRWAFHYTYWGLGIFCVLSFILLMRRSIAVNRERFFLMLVLILFILAYSGASIIVCPTTTWRYTMPFYLPSLAFMSIAVQDTCAWVSVKWSRRKKQV
jgi:hypothetical protein